MYHHLNIENYSNMDYLKIIDMLYLYNQRDIDMNNYLKLIYMFHHSNKVNSDNIDSYIDNDHQRKLLYNYKQQMNRSLYKYHH